MGSTKSEPPSSMPKELTADDAKRLAEAVRRIDKGMKDIAASGLNRAALITLLADSTKVGKRDINDVLNGLEQLGDHYLDRADTKKEKK